MQAYPFRDGGFERWIGARLAVVGAGMLGARLCEEAVLAGANVIVFDPDVGELANLGNQTCRPGRFKVDVVKQRCDAIRPGHLTAIPCDVRHANLRWLRGCTVWFDCTDDPNLAWPLTELSNGFDRVMFRCAVDGSGQTEIGRVLCSAGGSGHACQCCSYDPQDLFRSHRRTPCPGQSGPESPPTLAGGALAAGTAGLALSLAQRTIVGKDTDRILGHEFILDWTGFQMLHLRLPRAEGCLTGHRQWETMDLDVDDASGTLSEVFAAAEHAIGGSEIELETYLHPWNVQASCQCGAVACAVGTDWAVPPRCPKCSNRMQWLKEIQVAKATREQAASWGILANSLETLGVPRGAMFVARAGGHAARRLLLRWPKEGSQAQEGRRT